MTGDSMVDETTAISRSMVEAVEGVWSMYLVLLTEYWDFVAAVSLSPIGRLHRDPADDQLVVPEPIEEKGEHALFA